MIESDRHPEDILRDGLSNPPVADEEIGSLRYPGNAQSTATTPRELPVRRLTGQLAYRSESALQTITIGAVGAQAEDRTVVSTAPLAHDQAESRDEGLALELEAVESFAIKRMVENVSSEGLPALPFDLWRRRNRIALGVMLLFFFDVAVPLILYYILQDSTGLSDEDVLGYACLSVGIGELLELPVRGYRLCRWPRVYNGCGIDKRSAFDLLFWWYIVATIIGVVPYAVATSLPSGPLYKVFLMTPGMVVGFASAACFLSLMPGKAGVQLDAIDYGLPAPFRLSSDRAGEPIKPFVYYVVEDFLAVDCKQGRPWREACRARWLASPHFRRLMWHGTLFWGIGGLVFIAILAALTWGATFNVAYGLSFVWLFLWMMLCAATSWLYVRRSLVLERIAFSRRAVG
ncbi:hypothetical protein PYCC9005_001071 [Savitreella phatthalungensis]